jgi:kynurenine formamidase
MTDSPILAGEIRSFGKMSIPFVTPELLSLIKTGKVYSLEQIIETGIPFWSGHQPLVISPLLRHGDSQDTYPTSIANDFLSLPMHGSTHIDALCHIGKYEGDDVLLHGGVDAKTSQDNRGQHTYGAENFPPIILRGVLLDIAANKGLDVLPPSYGITGEDIAACEKNQNTHIAPGTAVLIRTGYQKFWLSDNNEYSLSGAGPNIDGAHYLVEKGAAVVGSDTEAVEQQPPAGPGLPVHQYLIFENGVTHIEELFLEDLSKDKVYEFLFICLPLRIKGATGSVVHPIAIC